MLAAVAIAALPATAAADESRKPLERATIVLLPSSVGTDVMADAGMAVGLLSAGHGVRAPAQTFLDISQGTRASDSLYERDLPDQIEIDRVGVSPPSWSRIVRRAKSAPAQLVPGLLATAIGPGGASAEPKADLGQLIAADRAGRIGRGQAALRVISARPRELGAIVAGSRADRLVIALAVPKVRGQRLISVGFAGAGFEGVLTSRTTRLDGLVSAIDLAPTILDLIGAEVPAQMNGRRITPDRESDPAEVADLRDRLLELSPRRTPVVWMNVGIWVLLAGLASAGLGRRGREIALPWLAVATAVLPGLLLVGAALEPSELVERLIVGLGSPALAWILIRVCANTAAGAYGAFALGAALSVGAHAIDVVAGSPLTALTVGGSNPSSGVRYFGIGNEHEAALSVLTLAGTGAALTRFGPAISARTVAACLAAVAVVAVLAFAPGRFGADVGMAITIPAGAAVAVALALGASRRGWLLVLLAPLFGVGALVAIDVVSGGDAHFSRSVLDAEEAADVADVFEGRLRLAWGSIERNIGSPFLWAALMLIGLAFYKRDAVRAALAPAPRPAVAGLAGAIAAIIAGTFANDSGITLFVIGIWFVIPFAGLVWVSTTSAAPASARRRS